MQSEAEPVLVSSQHGGGEQCRPGLLLLGCFSFLPCCVSCSDMHTLPNSLKSPSKFTGTRDLKLSWNEWGVEQRVIFVVFFSAVADARNYISSQISAVYVHLGFCRYEEKSAAREKARL